MTATFRLFRFLEVFSLCLLLFASPAWARHPYQDTDHDMASTEQDCDHEPDDHGQRFEQEMSDIEAHYTELVPEAARSTAAEQSRNDVHDNEESEDEEDEE